MVTLLGIFCLASCSIANKLTGEIKPPSVQAKLISYSLDDRYIYIDVVSHGCTMTTSFELRLVSEQQNSFEVIRKRQDHCRMKPMKMSLNYPFRHLGLDLSRPVNVVNPIDGEQFASN